MVGKKGVGKTFFLNYLLSVHDGIFDEEQVLYVRVALTHPEPSWTVATRFKYQACRIIKDHYLSSKTKEYWNDQTRMVFDQISIQTFEAWLKSRDLPRGIEIDDVLRGLDLLPVELSSGLGDLDRRTLGPVDLDTWSEVLGEGGGIILETLFSELVEFSKSRGFSFFFILDGLDAVTPDEDHRIRFHKWMNETYAFFLRYTDLPAAWLICMREESFEEVKQDLEERFVSMPRVVRIDSPKSNMVLDRRLDQVRDEYDSLRTILNGYPQLLKRVLAHSFGDRPEDVLPNLLQMLNQNTRELMRLLQVCSKVINSEIARTFGFRMLLGDQILTNSLDFQMRNALQQFLGNAKREEQFVATKDYLLLELLTLGRKLAYHERHYYQMSEGKWTRRRVLRADDEQIGFLINAFSFPDNVARKEASPGALRFAVLFKIMILAYIQRNTIKGAARWTQTRLGMRS